jgi:AAA domain-containing protein/nuclease-like protein
VKIRRCKTDGVIAAEVKGLRAAEEKLPDSWFGYASLEFIVPGRTGHEIDLVVVTHERIILVDLKDWRGAVTVWRDRWLQNGAKRGRSPVIKLREAAREIKSRLEQRLGGQQQAPYIDYLVVFTADCDTSALSPEEAHYTMSLEAFVGLAEPRRYDQTFPQQRRGSPLLALKSRLDAFFGGNDFRVQERVFAGYKAHGEAIFVHPRNLFREFRAEDVTDRNYTALLRLWDLDQLPPELRTNDQRARMATREKRAIGFLRTRLAAEDADGLTLRFNAADDSQPVPTDYFELYELSADQYRLDEFLERNRGRLSSDSRLRLMAVLLSKFAAIHQAGLAHRDLGEHCVWVKQPNLISLSGFATATFPDVQTIGEYREVLAAGKQTLPEDLLLSGTNDPPSDPFRRDVFSMGATLARLVYENPLPLADGVPELPGEQVPLLVGAAHRDWLRAALSFDPAERPADALELLRRFETLIVAPTPTIDRDLIARHATASIPYVAYPPSGAIEQGRAAKYRSSSSGDVFVKVWHGITCDTVEKHGVALVEFLHAASELHRRPIEGVAPVIDFGLSPTGLFLVTALLDAPSLGQARADVVGGDTAASVAFLRRLVAVVAALHERGLAHGDLKPEHVLIARDDAPAPYLVDVIDYMPGGRPRNTAYSPPRQLAASATERDRFALAKMAVEVMEKLLACAPSERVRTMKESLEERIADDAPLLKDTGELVRLFAPTVSDDRPTWMVRVSGRVTATHEFLLDDGKVIVTFSEDKKRLGGFRVRLLGLEERITVFWHPKDAQVGGGYVDPLFEHQRRGLLSSGVHVPVHARIMVDGGHRTQLPRPLTELIERAHAAAGSASGRDPAAGAAAITPAKKGVAVVPEPLPIADGRQPSIGTVWAALVEAESHVLPSVTVTGSPSHKDDYFLVPVQEGSRPIDFHPDETVKVFRRRGEVEDHHVGTLDARRSTATGFAIKTRARFLGLRAGETLVFRGAQDHESYRRRSLAVQRIVSDRAHIPQLTSYFDPAASPAIVEYPLDADNDELSKYSLNAVQRRAFSRVLRLGPLALLQGPPGTGKTRFIGALVHFLLAGNHARNILLVGQSHVAVNAGAEKVLDFAADEQFKLLTRIGQPSALSNRLLPYHPDTLRLGYRETFRANIMARLREMSRTLAAPAAFMEAVADILFDLGSLVTRAIAAEEKERPAAEELVKRVASAKYGAHDDLPVEQLVPWALGRAREAHNVHSPAIDKRTQELAVLAREWVACLGTTKSFDEFLARTRRVVCGTCVGVGRSRLGIADGQYDWVIVDEAGRCDPGELAVPLQAGKRVLLVGDHKQLPPMFDDDVVEEASSTLGMPTERLEVSDFERAFTSAYGLEVGTTLVTQYRMTPAICDLVSEVFYPETPLETEREPSESWHHELPRGLSADVVWVDTSALPRAFEEPGREESFLNGAEIDAVLAILKAFAKRDGYLDRLEQRASGEAPPIGIVCMYSAQKHALMHRLSRTAEVPQRLRRMLKVDTVDAYQGRQNVVVIVSMVRHNREQQQGFLARPERVNVAMSRAQDKLVIVGAAQMWRRRNAESPLGRVLSRIDDAQSDRVTVLSAKELFA